MDVDILFIYLFINYSPITHYILIIYELSNCNHVLGVVSHTKVSGLYDNNLHTTHYTTRAICVDSIILISTKFQP